MTSIIKFLKQCELFSGLDNEILHPASSKFYPVYVKPNQILIKEGEVDRLFYIVVEGEFSVLKETKRGLRELKRIGPGEAFGELALITEEKRTATVKALIEGQCIAISHEDFSLLIEKDAKLSKKMLKILADRLLNSDEKATQEILNAHQALIFSLANLLESRDSSTGYHLYRVREYCVLLAKLIAVHPKFAESITPVFIENIYIVSPLHDIGKVAIPDKILLKPGKFTPEESLIMKTHSEIGAESLSRVLEFCENDTFRMAYNIVRYHHERYDGTGYPDGFCQEEIPLEARIISLVDVFDALITKRVYKTALSCEQTIEEIKGMSGKMFDPDLVETMLSNLEAFINISRKYKNP